MPKSYHSASNSHSHSTNSHSYHLADSLRLDIHWLGRPLVEGILGVHGVVTVTRLLGTLRNV